MKNQEKDLKNENTGSTEKKVDKRRIDSFMSKNGEACDRRFREYMRMVEEERERAEQEKNQK